MLLPRGPDEGGPSEQSRVTLLRSGRPVIKPKPGIRTWVRDSSNKAFYPDGKKQNFSLKMNSSSTVYKDGQVGLFVELLSFVTTSSPEGPRQSPPAESRTGSSSALPTCGPRRAGALIAAHYSSCAESAPGSDLRREAQSVWRRHLCLGSLGSGGTQLV